MCVCVFVGRTKRKFGGEHFRFVVTLVFIQCVVNATFARVGTFTFIFNLPSCFCLRLLPLAAELGATAL